MQRVAWAVISALLVAALLGVFGDGLLARQTLTSSDGRLTARVQRFDRHRSPSAVVLTVKPEAGQQKIEIWISRAFAEDQTFETIHPEPDSVTAADDRYVYEFSVDSDEPEVHIVFNGMPEGLGLSPVSLGIQGGTSIAFRQFVFP